MTPPKSRKEKKVIKGSPIAIPTTPKKRPTKKTKRKHVSYSRYILKVLRQVHPGAGISFKAMKIMDNFVQDMFTRIAVESSLLVKMNNRRTLLARDIQAAVRLLLPGELGKHAMSEGIKATKTYEESTWTSDF